MPDAAVPVRPVRVRPSPYLLLVLAALFWSGNWIVGRALRGQVPPIGMASWRWGLAALLLAPVALPRLPANVPAILAHWRVLLLLGSTGTAVFNAMCYVGLLSTTATNGLLLQSFVPILVLALGRLWFGTKLVRPQVIGAAVSLSGVLCIVANGNPKALLALSLNRGDLWVLFALFFWAIYTLGLRWRPREIDSLVFLWVLCCVGTAVTLPGYAIEMAHGQHVHWSAQVAAGLLYIALFPSVLAYICWNSALQRVPPERASLFLHLMPVFGTIMSSIFLGEYPGIAQAVGMVLILAGISLTTRR